MRDLGSVIANPVRLLWLSAGGFAIVGCLFAVLGQVDSRVLENGEGVWLKPTRFALAFAIHAATLAWIGRLTERQQVDDRLFGYSAVLQIAVMLVEIACVSIQAGRGVASHFNYATSFDRAVFTVMGIGTIGLFIGFLLIIAGLVRRPAQPLATWAAIAALGFAALGGLAGVAMVMPSAAQAALLDAGLRPDVIGGHAVGLSSSPRLVFFGWEMSAGDWRIPHFLGLHALQMLPFVAWLYGSRSATPAGWRALGGAVVGYGVVFVWVSVQTAMGRSVFSSDLGDLAIIGLGAGLYALAVFWAATPAVRPKSA